MNKYLKLAKSSVALIAMISFMVAIIIPLPSFLIDIAIVLSLAVSITIYMRATSIKEWDELKTFPTILLLTAIFRIALNISTTRKILDNGQPGHVIEAAGHFIIGSNIWIGFVIFIILIVVQFIVANGATRTAEVNARFTLDGLPMKQMSIDNELNNGAISQEEAAKRRKKLDMEVDFYGNMDGASKFVKGDVIIGVVLFVVNILFGLIVGVVVQGMPLAEAASHFTLLSIGDGVVNQVSSLLIAVAAGIVMTRVYGEEKNNVANQMLTELTINPMVIYVVGGLFLVLGIFTKLPFLPFALIAGVLFYIGRKKEKELLQKEEEEEITYLEEVMVEKEKVEMETGVEPITVELGVALISVVAQGEDGETLQDKIKIMRQVIANELGVKIPQIHVVDNAALFPYERYRIKIKDVQVGEGELRTNRLLALKTPNVLKEIAGEPTKDPIFGEEAVWVTKEHANEAKDSGYMVYDVLNILSTHLNEVIQRHLYELLKRQEVQDLLDQVAVKDKVLIKEIENEKIGLGVIQGVLKNLLRESLSVKDLPTILEAVIDGHKVADAMMARSDRAVNKIDEITSYVRERISKSICEKNKNTDGRLYAILLQPAFEKHADIYAKHDGYYLNMNMNQEHEFVSSIIQEVTKAQMAEIEPILLVSRSDLRNALSRLLHKYNMPLSVLSSSELVPGIAIEQLGIVEYGIKEEII